jgi:pyruvate ferredoxin oxidoreductase alpha subunit
VAVLGGAPYSYFRYEAHLAMLQGASAYEEIARDFAQRFGRLHPAVEAYRCEDADIVFFMIGAFATKAKDAVNRLREAGWRVGLVRPRLLRPYPTAVLRELLLGRRAVIVIDQNLSMGKGGVLHSELASVLYGQSGAPMLLSFIGGLGGRDISPEEFYEMAKVAREAVQAQVTPEPRLLYSSGEWRELKKLQAIAIAERSQP